jgi:type III secretion system YscI/HrpB-like protein
MIKQALQGKNFNNKELLVLQYKVSTYSLEMDLTSKVVDKATGGIKQAMNTQV